LHLYKGKHLDYLEDQVMVEGCIQSQWTCACMAALTFTQANKCMLAYVSIIYLLFLL